MTKKITIALAIILFSISQVYSQTGEIKRISLSEELGTGGILNLYELGLAIKTSTSGECDFTFYDENLKRNGNAKLAFETRKESVINYYYDTLIKKILVFHGTRKFTNLTLIEPDKKKKKTLKLVMPAKKMYLNTTLVKIDKTIYAMTTKGSKTFLNTIELINGDITPVELPEEWKTRVILKMTRVNSKYLAVFYLDKTVKNKKFKNVALIDDDGKIVVDKLVTNDEDDFPMEEFSITDLGNEQMAIAGTYSTTVTSDYSIGLFVAKIDNLKLTYIKYFDYNTIKNFYNFMSEKKKEKAEKKAEKNAKKGKSTKYLAVTHPVIAVDGRLLVTAEFYYPTYRTESYTTYVNGKPTTSYRTVFDGFQYTHTMVLGINEDGKKDYEHCIPFHLDYKPYYASQKLKRRISAEEIKYSYIAFNKIYSFSLAAEDIKEHDPKTLVEVDEDKKLKSTYSSIDSWYDNYFYAKTEQTTKEKGKLIGGKETNYYLIKYGVE
ncbi:MAG: hypothetical protein ACKVQB_02565 [Bacteroidia bacterium]